MIFSNNTILKDIESGNIDYKTEVLKVHSDAYIEPVNTFPRGSQYYIIALARGEIDGSMAVSGKRAWQNAYEQLKKEGKI